MTEFRGTERFEVVRQLGQGGMGIVYEAHDREQGLKVALKCLNASATGSLLQLKDEFRALRDVHHPNLMSLGELVEADGQWFFTMELIEGTDLLAHLRPGDLATRARLDAAATENLAVARAGDAERGPRAASPALALELPAPPAFDATRVRGTLAQLAQGLQALHDAGKIHRDIKPSNLLVDRTGRLIISDFGLVTKQVVGDADLVAPGVAMGTPAYMAPELMRSRLLEPASDWFSVGVVLYQVLVGWVPFQGTIAAMQYQKLSGLAVPPRTLVRVDADLDELCMQLLAADPAQRLDGIAVLERLGVAVPDRRRSRRLRRPSERHLFVGRQAELDELVATMRRADAGPGELVVLQGESGVGKTTLARRFVELVLAEYPSALVLTGRCHERESVPYKAFDGVMDELTRHLRELPAAELDAMLPANAKALGRLFPVLAQLPALAGGREPTAPIADATEHRAQLFGTLRALLATLSARWPLIMIVDDLQWADADSFSLLRALLRTPTPPFMVLATVRASGDEPWVPEGGRHLLGPRVRHVVVPPLPPEAARDLVYRLADGLGAAAEVDADAIAAGAAGHPMFIKELLLHMKARGDWRARELALDDALYARTRQLSADARALLELVALVGTPIHHDVLRDAAAMPADRFAAAAAELQHERLTRATGLRRSDETEPFHARISETVIARLAPDQRRHAHARLASALADSEGADAELIAIHWQGAGEPALAYDYARRAAREADEALAFMRSVRLYRYCLALVGDGDRARTGELLEKLAEATANSGRSAEGAALYLQAAGHFEGLRGSTLRRLACEKFLQSGHFADGLRELATLLREVGQSLPDARWKVFASTLTQRARLRLRGYEPRPHDPATVTAAQLHEADLLWSATAGLGLIDTIRSAGFSARYLRLALDIGDPPRLVRALTSEYAIQAGMAGRETPTTRAILRLARTLADGSPELENHCDGMVSSVVFVHGADFRKACELALRAENYYLAHGAYRDELDAARHFVNASMWYLGDWAQLAERVTSQLAQALEHEDLFASTNLVGGSLSAVWLFKDQPETAEDLLAAQLARWPRDRFLVVHFYELYALAQLDLYRDDPGRALERVERGWRALQRSFLLRLPIIRFMMHDVRARAALSLASRTAGRERKALLARARRDRDVIAATGMCFGDAAVHLLDGTLAAVAGDAERSLEQWGRAVTAFDAGGLRMHAAAVRCRVARAQGLATDAAEAPLRDEQVVAPARLVRLLTAEI